MTLRRVLITVLISLCCLTAAEAAPFVGSRTRKYTKERPLIYEDSWKKWPYAFINDNGEPEGFNVDLVRRIMTRLNIPFEVRLVSQEKAHYDLQRDSADLSLGVIASYNAPFGRFGRFTITHFENSILLPKKDSVGLMTLERLRKIPFYVRQNSRAYFIMKEAGFPDSLLKTGDNMEAEILERYGRVEEYPVWNTMMVRWVKNKYHLDDFCVVPVDIPAGEYRFMSADTVLLARLDSICELMYREGELQDLQARWMSPNSEQKNSDATYAIIMAVIIFLLALLLNYLLHRYRKRHSAHSLAEKKRQMELILSSCKMRVWVYYPTSRRYSWMSLEGETDKEYSTYEFSRFYPDEEFSVIHSHVTDILGHDAVVNDFKLRCYDENDRHKVLDTEVRLIPMRNDYGKIYLIFGLQHDITDTKAMLDSKKLMSQRQATVFEQALGSIMRFDASGRMIDFNNHLMHRFNIENKDDILAQGFTLDDFSSNLGVDLATLGDDISFTSHVFGVPPSTPLGLAVRPIESTPVAEVMSAEGGKHDEGFYHVHIATISNAQGKISGYMLFVRDITEFVMATKKLREQQKSINYFRSERQKYLRRRNFILRETLITILYYDPDTRTINIYDRNTGQLTVYSLLQVLEFVDERDFQIMFRAFHHADARTPEELTITVRNFFKGKDHPLTHSINLFPVFDESGRVTGYFSICIDITERVSMQEELERETITARDIELVKQNFLKNMSYSIRQPLVVMRQNIEKLSTVEGNDELPLLNSVCVNTQRLILLSDDTLLLSRIEAGMLKQDVKALDFVELYRRSIDEGIERFRHIGVTYNVQNTYETLPIVADATVMSRILREAVGLSARYTNYGTVNVHYIYRREQLNIAIEDTGEGIPPGELKTLFEPQIGLHHVEYTQQDAQLSGLEMPICKALVEMLEGTIEVESEPGHGTSIFITLPL